MRKEFSVTEKYLIKLFDFNFCLNRSNCVHNNYVNNYLIESFLLKLTKSGDRQSLDVLLSIAIFVWNVRGVETHFVWCDVVTVGSTQLHVQHQS